MGWGWGGTSHEKGWVGGFEEVSVIRGHLRSEGSVREAQGVGGGAGRSELGMFEEVEGIWGVVSWAWGTVVEGGVQPQCIGTTGTRIFQPSWACG